MSNDQSNNPSKNSIKDPELYRRKARTLLRALRSNQSEQVSLAGQRFGSLRSFAGLTVEELTEPARIRLKHALAVVAKETGYESWTALLAACREDGNGIAASLEAMYTPAMAAMMNRWFADYNEAKQSLDEMGGFLLPYGRQFFVTERSGIEALGLDPDDSDWEKIAYNWLQPEDQAAWSRIWDKRRAVLDSSEGGALCKT